MYLILLIGGFWEREAETDRQTERETETETERQRQREIERIIVCRRLEPPFYRQLPYMAIPPPHPYPFFYLFSEPPAFTRTVSTTSPQ